MYRASFVSQSIFSLVAEVGVTPISSVASLNFGRSPSVLLFAAFRWEALVGAPPISCGLRGFCGTFVFFHLSISVCFGMHCVPSRRVVFICVFVQVYCCVLFCLVLFLRKENFFLIISLLLAILVRFCSPSI